MKRCPNCSLIFEDDNDFCVADGGVLVAVYSDNVSRDIPTQVLSRPAAASPAAAADNGSKVLYGIIGGLVALVLAMGATFFLVLNSQRETTQGNAPATNEKSSLNPLSAAQTSSSPATPAPATPALSVANQPATNKALPALPAPARLDISPRGRWSGDWSAPSGAYLTINVDLSQDGANRVSGQIEWTLRRTTRPEKMSKIGMKAIEYVSGQYDPVTRLVTLKGTGKDDPYGVLVMTDDYRLTLSEDNRRLNGAAKNGGKWNGRVNLSR